MRVMVHRYGQENTGKMGKYVTYYGKTFHVEVTRHPVKSLFDSFCIPPKQHVFRNVVKGYVH